MVSMLKTEKPRLFQCDTTFGEIIYFDIFKCNFSGTQKEGYKLHVVIYHSNTTDMWEVAGLLFISSETKEKVETGYAFFRDSLVSHGLNTGGEGPLIFYLDKDFDYIYVIETFFPNSYVFLCFIHTRRYFKDKVFTGTYAYSGLMTQSRKIKLLPDVQFVKYWFMSPA